MPIQGGVGNGRTIFNNKGMPAKAYHPYFSTTYEYEDEAALAETGMTPVIHYDPAGRIIKTNFPNGTFSKVEFNAWFYRGYDVNDTVRDVDCNGIPIRGAPDPLLAEPADPEKAGPHG